MKKITWNSKVKNQRKKREVRSKSKIRESEKRPRLVVYRSNKYIYAQLIDDIKGKTIAGVGEKNINIVQKISKTEKAKIVGQEVAKIALKNSIKEVIFDRHGYKYHGRVKALAEGARSGGLKF